MKSHDRIEWLDFAKGITMSFVILAHCDSIPLYMSKYDLTLLVRILYYILFIIIMPLFFSISGFLYKKITSINNFELLVYKKLTSLMLPCVLFAILYNVLFNTENLSRNNNVVILKKFVMSSTSSYLWFLFVLFFIFIIMGLLDLLKINVYVSFVIFLIITIYQHLFWTINNFNISTNIFYNTSSYILFFIMGFIIKSYKTTLLSMFGNYRFRFLIFTLFVICVTVGFIYSPSKYQTDIVTLIDFFPKFLSIPLFFGEFFVAKHDNIFNYFAFYGRYSLIIYLVQIPIIYILERIFNYIYLFQNSYFYITILAILTWIISVFIVRMSIKNKFLDMIFYPRKYINKFF